MNPNNIQEFVANRVIEYLKERDEELKALRKCKWNRTCGICEHELLDGGIQFECSGCGRNMHDVYLKTFIHEHYCISCYDKHFPKLK
jgi:hypothetical protein